jgi:hypothetical protein
LTVILTASCSKDDESEKLYQSYGVVREDVNISGKLYIRSDNGKVIVPTLSGFLANDSKDRRVWMMFSINNNINSDTIKANIYDFLKITDMDVKSENDELKSDVVYPQAIWVAQDYLTMIIDVMAGSETSLKNHAYTVYSDFEIVNDTVRMEFKYDRNNDALNKQFSKIVALKLDDRISPAQDSKSIVLAIKYLSNTNTYKEEYVVYEK